MTAADPAISDSSRYWSALRMAQVRSAREERSRRAQHFPSELFSEPGWDLLLELYAFHLAGRSVSEAELVERLLVSNSVSVRWLKVLETQNLVAREVNSCDRSQVRVELTPKGLEALNGYFSDQP